MDPEIWRQVWPVFSGEAREHLETIGAAILELERGGGPELFESIQRTAHSLKGSAASLGLADVESLAHAIEGAVARSHAQGKIDRSTTEAALRAVGAVATALDRAGASGEVRIEDLPALRAALQSSDADPTAGGEVRSSPPPEPESLPAVAAAREDGSIRVSAGRIDSVTRRIDSLTLGEARAERRSRELMAVDRALREGLWAARRVPGANGAALSGTLERMEAGLRELGRLAQAARREAARQQLDAAAVREDLRDLRTVPAAVALEPLRRIAREAAGRLGKEIDLRLTGGEIRLDRRIPDRLKDSLMHLVRNAVDHGIEPAEARTAAGKPLAGRIEIRVEARGHRIGIAVADDGTGLSTERIRSVAVERGLLEAREAAELGEAETYRLIFAPGFSTAREVTTLSGRGVGLDVVHEAVTRLRGAVQVFSAPGRGTTFDLDLPLTLAAATGVLCRVGRELAAIPAEAVERVVRLDRGDLGTVGGLVTARIGGTPLPFAHLGQLLGMPPAAMAEPNERRQLTVVLALRGSRLALGVDEVLGERELVVSSLGRRVERVPHIAGAALLDDGCIVAVLNPADLLQRSRPASRREQTIARARIVVADDALTTRSTMKAILEIAGYTVLPAADGDEAWELVSGGRTDLVVTDVQMPGLDGLALTRRIKSDPRLKQIPVLLVTSLDAPEDRTAGLEAGADGYLAKRDVEAGKLLELVRLLLPGPA